MVTSTHSTCSPVRPATLTATSESTRRTMSSGANSVGMPVMPAGSGADGNGNGIVKLRRLALWRATFGMGVGPGAGAALGAGLTGITVPNPAIFSLVLIAMIAVWVARLLGVYGADGSDPCRRQFGNGADRARPI